MITEERLAIEARVAMAEAMVEPDSVGLLEWYLRDVPKLLELVDNLRSDYRDQIKELFSRLPDQSHWCPEWDDLLILPSDTEFEACICYDN